MATKFDFNKYSLGIAQIDKNHKKIITILQNLKKDVEGGDAYVFSKDNIKQLVGEAQDFATQHFREEEELMITFGYPQYRSHRNEHDLFFEKLEYLSKLAFDENIQKEEVREFIVFLNEWFSNHICNIDRQYAEWIRASVLQKV